jgi:hypothetical protein
MCGMYSREATQVKVTVCVSEGGSGIREASGEAIKVGEGLRVGAKGMRCGSMVVVAYCTYFVCSGRIERRVVVRMSSSALEALEDGESWGFWSSLYTFHPPSGVCL